MSTPYHEGLEFREAISDVCTLTRNKDPVLKIMNEMREMRLAHQHHQCLAKRTLLFKEFLRKEFGIKREKGLELPTFFPPFRDLVSLPAIKAVLDSPQDTTLTLESFAFLRHDILGLFAELQEQQKRKVRQWFERSEGIVLSNDTDLFDLAMASYLKIKMTRGFCEYDPECPPLFEHYFIRGKADSCRQKTCQHHDSRPEIHGLYEACMDKIIKAHSWNQIDFQLDTDRIKWVIEAVGENPANATTDVMDRKAIRWYCERCDDGRDHLCLTMNWRAVVSPSGYASLLTSSVIPLCRSHTPIRTSTHRSSSGL